MPSRVMRLLGEWGFGVGMKVFIYDVVAGGELVLWGCSLADRKIAKNVPPGVLRQGAWDANTILSAWRS